MNQLSNPNKKRKHGGPAGFGSTVLDQYENGHLPVFQDREILSQIRKVKVGFLPWQPEIQSATSDLEDSIDQSMSVSATYSVKQKCQSKVPTPGVVQPDSFQGCTCCNC